MGIFSSRRQVEDDHHEQREAAQIARTPASQSPIGFETVLGTHCEMEGKLSSEGNVRLDGTFSGHLNISGNVLVGETAKINADIHARNVSIAGAVRGNVSGNKIQILRTGRVWGDISARALTTEEGAFIDGRITMKDPSAQDESNANEGEAVSLPAPEGEAAQSTPPPPAGDTLEQAQTPDEADEQNER